ncbi:nucleotidyltransferase family protein [Amycolatopsis sp. YIM 10]|uniref:nucleotidyltransferase family protein n=1 Tax=Amycolatopsis sp. YIM 10 TaxID=2653857 RepID=UPI0012A78367|nr:nucleotidyltransferase domain-containing protein [Amycolatopsis sp. YIM 10]QFU93822.1 Nucleotidyltransferase domain protein [Amycolatopsis sp. YIM 10]
MAHEFVTARLSEIQDLCRRFGVLRLDLFGSAADGSFDPERSDIDVLVEFDFAPGIDRFANYFGLKEGLEALFGRPVDLVSVTAIVNPYFRRSVVETRELLYAA